MARQAITIMNFSANQIRQLKKAAERASQLRGGSKLRAMQQARKIYSQNQGQMLKLMGNGPGATFIKEVSRALSKSGVPKLLGQSMASAAGQDIRGEVARYAKGGIASQLLQGFLGGLGPVGKAVSMLLGRHGGGGVPDSAIRDAINLLTTLGFEVRLPPASQTSAAHAPSSTLAPPTTSSTFDWLQDRFAQPPVQPDAMQGPALPMGSFPANRMIPMQLVSSSNVYAIGYQVETLTMRVQYLGTTVSAAGIKGHGHSGKNRVKGKLGRTLTGRRQGPGATYDYRGVPQAVFNRIQNAGSKGGAIWDNLRIRGTVYGHKFDYELVAGSRVDVVLPARVKGYLTDQQRIGVVTYIPRKAVGPGMFQSRTMQQGTRQFKSLLPSQGMRNK